MATIQYNFPTSSVAASNPSVGLNGSTAPLSSTEIGWIDGSGNLQGVSATNPLPISAASLPLPSGAATSANQTTEITKLTSIDGKTPALGQAVMSASTPVVIASNQSDVPVLIKTTTSTANSTATPLIGGASWTGTGEDVSIYGVVSLAVYADVASAALGLEFQFSNDNVNWYTTDSYTIVAGTVKNYSLAPVLKYFRAHYTNNSSAQTTFFVETSYRQTYVKPSSHRIGDNISANDDSELVTAQIVGYTTSGGGSYVNVKCNPSGALNVAATQDTSPWVVSGTVAATQSGTWNVGLNAGSNLVGKVGIDQTTPGTTNGVYVNNASIPVSGTVAVSSITNALPAGTNTIGYVKGAGLAKANTPVYNSYSSTSVTTSAYVQLIASTTAEADVIQIFDSSGQAMILATGSAGSEVDQIYIPPGGADFQLYIAAGTRVSIKALTGTASSGYLLVNLLG